MASIDRPSLASFYEGKRVAVTGAAGTVGSELVRQLQSLPVREIRLLDNHEGALFLLEQEMSEDDRVHSFLADVRNAENLTKLFRGMDYVFHSAALKHVPFCERSPFEAVQTNIVGVENVIRAANLNGVSKVLFTSSDKAVNPTNVMGTSKLMGERLITAGNALQDNMRTVYASTRFGNVAGSQGSVIPLFCRQIAKGGPITLTDPRMSRFIMTLAESVSLVMESMVLACGGEVFVTKMPVINIRDLAEVLVEVVAPLYRRTASSIEIREVGARPGEKLYEELITDEEIRRTIELERMFAITPAFRNIYDRVTYAYPGPAPTPATRVYNSAVEPVISRDELRRFLLQEGVLPEELRAQLAPARLTVAAS